MLLIIVFTSCFCLYIFMRLSLGISKSATCLVGKTAIITGANSGIGYQTALNLASRGCKVVMADVADMEESRNNIIEFTNNRNILTKFVDLSSLKSVRDFARDIIESEERLDILINNAGIGISDMNRTEDGLHPVMQINYFSHFLLTHLLVDLLRKSAPSRIVFTASSLAFFNMLSLENLNFNDTTNNTFTKILSYFNSKMAVIMACDIFAEKLKLTGITSNSIHPGFVKTPIIDKTYSLFKTTDLILIFIMRLYMWIYSKDAWEGSQTLVHVAVSKKLQKVSGKHFWDCKPFIKPWKAYNKELCQKIWKASEEFVHLKEEERI